MEEQEFSCWAAEPVIGWLAKQDSTDGEKSDKLFKCIFLFFLLG